MAKKHDYDKILTRLTIILQRLYEGEILSTSELAEEFNVSSKTIQRDFNERLIRFPIEKIGRKCRYTAFSPSQSNGRDVILDSRIKPKSSGNVPQRYRQTAQPGSILPALS